MEQRVSFLSYSSSTFLKFRLDWLLYCMQLCGNLFYNFNLLFRENHSLLDRATIAETLYIYIYIYIYTRVVSFAKYASFRVVRGEISKK